MLTSYRDRDPFFGGFFDDIAPDFVGVGYPSTGMTGTRGGDRRAGERTRMVGKLIMLDAYETDNEFKVVAEVPGVEKDSIDLKVDNGILTIKINKPSPDFTNTFNMVRNEVVYGSDSRSVRIPVGTSPDPSNCCYKNGVLCITFPKAPESATSKKLNIET